VTLSKHHDCPDGGTREPVRRCAASDRGRRSEDAQPRQTPRCRRQGRKVVEIHGGSEKEIQWERDAVRDSATMTTPLRWWNPRRAPKSKRRFRRGG